MAMRVPTVSGPTVEDRPLQGGFQRSSVSPEMLAGGVTRLMAESGKVLQDVGAQLQEREDTDTVMRAETEVKGKYLEWEAQAKQRKGEAAKGVTKEASDFWDEQAGTVGGTLSTPRQKAVFGLKVQQLKALSVGAFSGFEQEQRRDSLDKSAQASIVQSINMAAANPLNAEMMQTTRADILQRNQARAQLNGWDSKVAEGQVAQDMTNLHKQVIQALVRDRPEAAQTYFEANKGEINGSEHAEVGAFAAKATATRMGETAAEAAWQTLGPKGDRDAVQLDKLDESIRKRTDLSDEAKKSAIAALRERAIAFKDSRRERDETLEANVNRAILGGATGAQIRAMPEFLQLAPEAARKLADFMENKALRAEQVAAARESRAAAQEGRAAAREARLDAAESREQRRMGREGMGAYLVYSNPDTLVGMTENQVINLLPSLGNELTQHLMQQKRALGKPGKLEAARIDQDTFNHLARQMKLPVDKTTKTEAESAAIGELKYRVERVIEAAQQRAGKPIPEAEKEDLMRREMARTVTVDTWGWNNLELPVIALTPAQFDKVIIPAADRQALTADMRVMYERTRSPMYAPTPENLKRFYLLKKSPDTAGMILPRN